MKTKTTKSNKWIMIFSFVLLVSLVLAACNVPGQPTESIDDAVLKAMQTLQAQATLESFQTMVAQTTGTITATSVPATQVVPGQTQVLPSATQVPPTATQVPPTATKVPPTATYVPITPVRPTATKIPPTSTTVPCNWVKFVSDVTIPDGTKITAGSTFTKTWRLKNAGSCTWTTEYDLAFVKGDQLSAPAFVDMPKAVKPGESIDLSVSMIAPSTAGDYKGHWMIVNQNGVRFGPGADAKGTFWVDIEATGGSGEVYSFTANACRADWNSGNTDPLSCPGKETDVTTGYIVTKAKPIREDGGTENEPGLVTRPNTGADGVIQGVYPAFTVANGDKFKATIQCEGGSTNCNIFFELKYRIGSESPVSLGKWSEIYDKHWNKIEVDLSSLAGEKVEFILIVRNGDTSEDNRGLWLHPMIYRP
ncbi:MAG: NBR1-Ig-like domain-containing protein [Anaerolineaceae bacterium]